MLKAKIKYYIRRCISKLPGIAEDEYVVDFFRKEGIQIGTNCHIYSMIVPSEPFLVHIGNDVTISTQVEFVTHDNSIIKVNRNLPNLFGHIQIGNNCFIGQRSMILYGVTLADNIIVAAGTVVCNSFEEERIIIGGNPAKKIGTWDQFEEANGDKAISRFKVREMVESHPDKFVRKKVKCEKG